ncbi:MAG: hypothetical protein KDD69_13760 [Bdellovibrionales bacterium]|nr:hypothetical protein [Bdellovibrionales bacterium]
MAADCEASAACAVEEVALPSEREALPLPLTAVLAAGATAGASVIDTTLMGIVSA